MRILGITDERTECDCCGKTNLKCTVALEKVDAEGNGTGEIVYFGRDCAARTLHGNNKSKNVKRVESLAKAIEYAKAWLRRTEKHTAAVVASAIRVRFTNCSECSEFGIEFGNGVVVAR
jgi:hypothetical protein